MSENALKFIVLLNGPPGCGKDTLADYMVSNLGADHYKFSAPLKRAWSAFFNAPLSYLEAEKDLINRQLGYLTFRQCQIHLSILCKNLFGVGIFGSLLAKEIKQSSSSLVVVSDSGFMEELCKLHGELPDTAHILILQVTRPGCSFENDSRNYLDVSKIYDTLSRVTVLQIDNDRTVEAFYSCASDLIQDWQSCIRLGR